MSCEPPSNPAHRPGSSMSISSMLGSDADRPARDAGSSVLFSRTPVTSAPFGSAPSISAPGAMSPPTASRHPVEYPLFRRSQTPEKSFSTNHPVRPYRSSSGGISHASEQARFGSLPRAPSYPEKHNSTHPSPQVSPTEAPYSEPRRLSLSGSIPRPNSQPQHLDPSPRMVYSPLSRPAPGLAEGPLGPTQRPPSYMGFDSQHARFGGLYADRQADEQAYRDRERALGHEPDPKAPYPQSRYVAHYGDRDAPERHSSASTWDLGRSQPPSPESKRFPVPESGSGFGFGAIQSYTKSLGSQAVGSRQSSLSIQPRQGQQSPPPHEQPYLSKRQSQPRLFATPSAPAGPTPFGPSGDEQRRKGNDELFHHRTLLGVGMEGKRGGRASPLPQAVQGAQAQILGPASEPGIKNELGRVFSGIGSGVGGVSAAIAGTSGPPTPMTTSPFKRESIAGRSATSETTEDIRNGRPSSATGKRSRRSRDEDAQLDGEAGFDPRTGASARGRRGRHAHHHHHQYASRFCWRALYDSHLLTCY